MLIARPNFKSIREIQPTISFTLFHIEGKAIEGDSLKKIKNLKCFEIQFKATGHTALEILAICKEMSKKLEAADIHVSYKRGVITFQMLTAFRDEKVEEYVKQKGRHYYIYCSVQRKKKNISLWMINKEQINSEYEGSKKYQKFISSLSNSQNKLKELILN